MTTALSIFNCTLSYIISYICYMLIYITIIYVEKGNVSIRKDVLNQQSTLGRINTVIYIVSILLLIIMTLSGLYLLIN